MGTHLPWLGVVVVAVVLGACGESSPTPSADAGPYTPPAPLTPCDPRLFAKLGDAGTEGPGETYDYVINRMMVDEGAEPGVATRSFYGFNLDDRFSPSRTARQLPADCSHGDYFSTLDPDQNVGMCALGSPGGGTSCQGGVDNQLANAMQTIDQISSELTGSLLLDQQINAGRYTLVVRVSGVNGALGATLKDPSVTIRVYPVVWPTFQGCDGIQQRQQTYAVDDRSLRQAGNLDTPLMQFSGCIVQGRLRQPFPNSIGAATPMVLPLVGTVRVTLNDLRIRFDPRADEGLNSNLGGTVSATETWSVLGKGVSDMVLRELRTMVQGFVDIAGPGHASGLSCDSPYGLISIGLGFTALRAHISPTTVSGPIPGACGDLTRDGGVDGGLMDATGNGGGDAGIEDVETGTGSLDAGVGDVGGDR